MSSANLTTNVEEEFLNRCKFNVKWKKHNGREVVDVDSLPEHPPEVDALNWYLTLSKREQARLRKYDKFKESLRYLKSRRDYDMIITQVLVTFPPRERKGI